MGVTDIVFNKHCKQYFVDSISILELGAQEYIANGVSVGYFSNIFKEYNIKSIDLNGENSALRLDLAKDINTKEHYDLISNFGTSEHVSDQYTCWKNIHDLLSDGGIVISELPEKGSWKGHCKYYIDYSFMKVMSKDFEIIDYRSTYYPPNGYLSFSILKKKSQTFLTTREELEDTIFVDHDTIDKISF
jgi:hypothetical protein